MKRIYTILLAATLLLAATACQQDPAAGEAPEPGFHAAQELSLHIPAPSPLAATRATAPDKTAWQEGDVLYIDLRCWDSGSNLQRTTHIAQYTAAGGWTYDTPLILHPATSTFDIYTYYTSGILPGEAITGDMLYSRTEDTVDETTLTLNPLDHRHSRITFTGLAEGEEITFDGSGWNQSQLTENYGLASAGTPTRITADTDGDAILYAFIEPGEHPRLFTIAGQEYSFDPGEPNANTYYYNRTYTINYPKLLAGGGMTPEEMEEEEKKEAARAPFLAWATSVRWKMEDFTLTSDIDLTGVKFEPIGANGGFSRTFDGGGHTITGLTVETDKEYAGMFHYIAESGTVKNLHLRGAHIKSTYRNGRVGGIAGWNNGGTISGCTVQGEIAGSKWAGGIAGYQMGGSTTACGFCGTLTGGQTGGIIGYASNGPITSCWALSTGGTKHQPIANIGVSHCIGQDIDYELTAEDIAIMNMAIMGTSFPLRWQADADGGLPKLIQP